MRKRYGAQMISSMKSVLDHVLISLINVTHKKQRNLPDSCLLYQGRPNCPVSPELRHIQRNPLTEFCYQKTHVKGGTNLSDLRLKKMQVSMSCLVIYSFQKKSSVLMRITFITITIVFTKIYYDNKKRNGNYH